MCQAPWVQQDMVPALSLRGSLAGREIGTQGCQHRTHTQEVGRAGVVGKGSLKKVTLPLPLWSEGGEGRCERDGGNHGCKVLGVEVHVNLPARLFWELGGQSIHGSWNPDPQTVGVKEAQQCWQRQRTETRVSYPGQAEYVWSLSLNVLGTVGFCFVLQFAPIADSF